MVADTKANHEVQFIPSHENQLVAHGKSVSGQVLEMKAPGSAMGTLIFNLEATAAGEDSDRWAGYEDDINYGWDRCAYFLRLPLQGQTVSRLEM